MFFVEWWLVIRACALLIVISGLIVAFRSVRKKRAWPLRLPVQFLSVLLGACIVVLVLFVLALPNPNSYSAPLYSPNHKMAVRVANYDAGPLGGANTSVELFSDGGLVSRIVFFGEWRSVEAENLRWIGDSEVEVKYVGSATRCASTQRVIVHCVNSEQYQR
jgi:hypothetical protein